MDMFYDNLYSSVSVSLTFFIIHCMDHMCWEGAFGLTRPEEWVCMWGGRGGCRGLNGWRGGGGGVNIMQLYNYVMGRWWSVEGH